MLNYPQYYSYPSSSSSEIKTAKDKYAIKKALKQYSCPLEYPKLKKDGLRIYVISSQIQKRSKVLIKKEGCLYLLLDIINKEDIELIQSNQDVSNMNPKYIQDFKNPMYFNMAMVVLPLKELEKISLNDEVKNKIKEFITIYSPDDQVSNTSSQHVKRKSSMTSSQIRKIKQKTKKKVIVKKNA